MRALPSQEMITIQVPAILLAPYIVQPVAVAQVHEEEKEDCPLPLRDIGSAWQVFEPHFTAVCAKVAEQNGWPKDKVSTLASQLFFSLRAKAVLEAPMQASLPVKLDMCWHALLLETYEYVEFCKLVCGRFLHHTLATEKDDASVKDARRLLLKAVLQTRADEWVWTSDDSDEVIILEKGKKKRTRPVVAAEPDTQFLKTMTGRTITLNTTPDMTIMTLKRLVFMKEGIPVDHQRLIYAGKQLDPRQTVGSYNIRPNSTFHLVMALSGC